MTLPVIILLIISLISVNIELLLTPQVLEALIKQIRLQNSRVGSFYLQQHQVNQTAHTLHLSLHIDQKRPKQDYTTALSST